MHVHSSYVVMSLRLLQLNIKRGARLGEVIRYIRKHNFDFVILQEVNCFKELLDGTGMAGELAISVRFRNDPHAYLGLATLFRRPWQIESQTTVCLSRGL